MYSFTIDGLVISDWLKVRSMHNTRFKFELYLLDNFDSKIFWILDHYHQVTQGHSLSSNVYENCLTYNLVTTIMDLETLDEIVGSTSFDTLDKSSSPTLSKKKTPWSQI